MRSLRSRLILSHILPLLIVLPAAGFLLVNLIQTQYLLANISNDLIRQAVLVADVARSQSQIWYDSSSAQTFVTHIGPRLTAKMMLLDPQGRLVVSSDPIDQPAIGRILYQPQNTNTSSSGEPQVQYNGSDIMEVVVPVVDLQGGLIGYVRLTNPFAEAYGRSVAVRNNIIWIFAGSLLIGVALGLLLANDLARRLGNATKSVTLMASSGSLKQIEAEGPKEIRQLYQAFNLLVVRLQTLEENRKRLLANLVHELGRPLGALQSGVQALQGGAMDEKPLRDELLAGMKDELHRLKRLVDDLSGLRDQVTGTLEMKYSLINPCDWVPRVMSTYRGSAQQKGLMWEENLAVDLPPICIDADRLAQALENLIGNSIRYTPSGGKVGIKVEASGEDRIRFTVFDSGPGIPEQEKGLIFQPFFRGRSAKRFSDGMGLGLTIAHDIVTAHHGEIQILDTHGKGAVFELTVPIKPPSSSI
jgi:two-component system, OmpR family, sensor histidine kinase BaeS